MIISLRDSSALIFLFSARKRKALFQYLNSKVSNDIPHEAMDQYSRVFVNLRRDWFQGIEIGILTMQGQTIVLSWAITPLRKVLECLNDAMSSLQPLVGRVSCSENLQI